MLRNELAAADLQHCEALLARGSKTFSLASRLLPRELRPAVVALYAFCRVSDDLVDDGVIAPERALEMLRERLDKVYAGEPGDDAVDRALAVVVAAYALPRAWLDALVEGYLWDAQGRTYATFDDVLGYAARVAGSVGACMALFMGASRRDVLARACDLGVAMQLTNIARDIVEDARRGRVYLPGAWLADAGIDARNLVARPEVLSPVVERLLNEADAFYARADVGIGRLPARFRKAIRAARWMYAEIGEEIRRRECDVSTRATVPLWRKLWIVVKSFFPSRRERDRLDLTGIEACAFLLEAPRTP